MKMRIIGFIAMSMMLVSCTTKEHMSPPAPPVVVQPPATVPPVVAPEVPCQKDEKIHFVVCDSNAVGNCKYHTDLNNLLAKAKGEGFKNCITYRGTEVMSGSAPCMACKKPGYSD